MAQEKHPPGFLITRFQLAEASLTFPFATELLKIFLDIGYYLCFLPYKFVWVSQTGFCIKKNLFQRGLCIFFHAGLGIQIIFRVGSSVWLKVEQEINGNPPKLFYNVLEILSNSLIYYNLWLTWTKMDQFEWMLSLFPATPDSCPINESFTISTTITTETPQDLSTSKRTKMKRLLVKATLGIVFVLLTAAKTYEVFTSVVTSSVGSVAYKGYTLVLLGLILFQVTEMMTFIHFFNMFFFVLIMVIKERVDSFVRKVLGDVMQGEKVLESYFEMKRDIQKINDAFSTWTLLFIMTSLPFYCLEIRRLVQLNGEIVAKVLTGLYIMYTASAFTIASRANAAVDKVKGWLSVDKNVESISSKKLILLLNELDSGTIGIKGGNYFTLSYHLIANITGLILTYTVIILQWNERHSTS